MHSTERGGPAIPGRGEHPGALARHAAGQVRLGAPVLFDVFERCSAVCAEQGGDIGGDPLGARLGAAGRRAAQSAIRFSKGKAAAA